MRDYCITPNDSGLVGATDSESIQNAVCAAKKQKVNRVIIPAVNARTGEAVWDIDRAIVLPSDIEIVLDNCVLRQADGSFDNVFRNFADPETVSHTAAERTENIVIRGVGKAVIDGGVHNGLTERTQLTEGFPSVSRNNSILLFNVRGFRIENLHIKNQRWWAINLIHCVNGDVGHIDFEVRCDVPNQDGIDVRIGCHDVSIHDVTGRCGDDLIAVSALGNQANPRSINSLYYLDDADEDIHDIIIRDVFATSYTCALVALRNMDRRKLYNITIRNVHDTGGGVNGTEPPPYCLSQPNRKTKYTVSPYAVVRIGQDDFFYAGGNTLGETYNVCVTGVYARVNHAVMINGTLDKSYIGRVFAGNEVDTVITTKSDWDSQAYGADIRDTVIENIFFDCIDNEDAIAFDFARNKRDNTIENVMIRNAFVGNCKTPIRNEQKGKPTVDGLHGKFVQ